MVRKVAIYTRVSTLDQTIDNQLIELRDYCSKMGWEITPIKTNIEIFITQYP
jgi:DNA invertase Pin-like site-specific DNA recombinase